MNDLIKAYEKYAAENGFKLNPNKDLVRSLVSVLLKNEEKYGNKYCPCRRLSGDPKEDEKNICPCAFHREEIRDKNHCCCNLFIINND